MGRGNPPKILLSDEEFMSRLNDLGWNKSALARDLGVSSTAIRKRYNRIEKPATKSGKVVIASAAAHAGAVQKGITEGAQQVKVLESLHGLLSIVEINLNVITAEMAAHKATGAKNIKPYHLDMLVKAIRTGKDLITDIFKIKKELFNIEGAATFMKAVVNIMEKYDPEVQEKLYAELSRVGFGEQAHSLDEDKAAASE